MSFHTDQVRQALRARYPMPEYCLMEEVRDGAGFNSKRSADAVVMSLWPSRGLEVQGFEIKVSRGDWLRELKDPAKVESIARYCDRWWIAVYGMTADQIVKEGELPETWGLMVFDGKRLTVKKEAPKNPDPVPLDRTFIAAMMRRVGEIDEWALRQKVQASSDKARKDAEAKIEKQVQDRTRSYQQLTEKLAKLKVETGIDLEDWHHSTEAVSAAIRFALAAGIEGKYSALMSALTAMERGTSRLRSRGPKMTPIRKSAKDQECTIRLPMGVCNYDTTTTVLCHSNDQADGKGLGLKARDTEAAYGCSACHDVVDGRAPRPEGMSYELMISLFRLAIEQTQRILKRKGLLKVDQ